MRMVVRRMMMIMMTMTMMKTCGDVPECVQDWQVELADKVKRLALALFHLSIVVVISTKNFNTIVIIITTIVNIIVIIIISRISCYVFVL